MAAKKKSPKKPQERNLTRELSLLLAKTLLPDLQARAQEPSVARALAAQYDSERKHTADSLPEWTTRTLEQVAVAWILSCVFIRTLEDRGYLTHPRLAGEGAADSEHLFFDLLPSLTQRDYLLAVFRELSHLPGGEEVLAPKHNPAWRLAPSTEAVRTLLAFFREVDSEGKLVWSFAGESTRFLGDLYQDVSEAVRERYALLQTPDFVEEFILDLTLDPAIAEFGLEEVRLIDPTCGSGHFLLGAFKRLFEARQRKAPATAAKEHAGAALAQVYGADINPYAVGIARFRLVLAYLQAAGIERLKDAPRISTNVVVADSLLFAADNQTLPFAAMAEDATAWGERHWQFEEPKEVQRIFSKRFHAVVGNPPYITCKDARLRDAYRESYESCYREFSLAAPFTERFFQLAIDDGFVGMINANSFTKREFGKALIERVLPKIELTRVMDSSGAYIPGHGTPTILLFGRNRAPVADSVIAVLGKRGEAGTPTDAANGVVWSSIRSNFASPGFEDDSISVSAISRDTLKKHPWSLSGGGAAELKLLLEQRSSQRLSQIAEEIGFVCMTRADDIYFAPSHALRNAGVTEQYVIENVEGEVVRDWCINAPSTTLFPYDENLRPVTEAIAPAVHRFLWPYRTMLWLRREPNGNHREIGLAWWEWSRFQRERYRSPMLIAFASVATHNHFVLDAGGKVFKQTAPIIKLPPSATKDDHFALLAYLNSSTACFWMKQVSYPKGRSDGDVGDAKGKPEANRYDFAATALLPAPIPNLSSGLSTLGRELDSLAIERQRHAPKAVLTAWLRSAQPLDGTLIAARQKEEEVLKQMIAVQENIDWITYSLVLPDIPQIASQPTTQGSQYHANERPFAASDPPKLCHADVAIWQGRKDSIRTVLHLALLENAVQKRSWVPTRGAFAQNATTFEERLLEAASEMLSAKLETFVTERPMSALASSFLLERDQLHAQLADLAKTSAQSLADVVCTLLIESAVPFLAAYRYSDTGSTKRALWEESWRLQRREDVGEKLDIPVPPKYDSKDFREPAFWRLRGKLDVPKERFISYPGAEKDDDKSPLFGWAGWDHLQQATALAGLYHERKTEDGWPADRLVPLLAGLLELVPWLKQWHNAPNDDLGGEGPGDWYERYVEAESRSIGKTVQDLRDWRPAKGRGSKAS